MKTILVPTDFNEVAEKAMNVAVKIAREKNAKIKLLTMLHFPKLKFRLVDSAVYSEKEYHDILKIDANREIKRWQDWYPDVDIKGLIKEEEGQGLIPILTSQKADLIVMGSEGASGWKDYFKGTNTQNVVRNAQCPVLVLKQNSVFETLTKVLFVTDFVKTDFIQKAKSIFDFENTNNHFVFIDAGDFTNDHKEIRENALKVQKKYKINNFAFEIYKANSVQKGILEYAEKLNVDLIVLYTNGRHGLDRFVLGSIAEQVVDLSVIPVLSIVE